MNAYYVQMTDNFMSGWGKADGLVNKFIIECQTLEQAKQIEKHARTRSEMSNVRVTESETYYPESEYLVSRRDYSDMGGVWTED